ncbi:MAG: hypothetical protein OEZ68_02790 [Gammaproteobacteria bacterium]|nr:hypothetical protein [Gammaproteobacteria bacterium]MDH5799708.1 hypothetical protein [Gammaproteobacteria bacterium]
MQPALAKNLNKSEISTAAENSQGLIRMERSAPAVPLSAKLIPQEKLKRLARRSELFFAVGLMLFVAALFILGRIFYDERYYTPEEGLGYFLGLTGGVMMLAAFFYTAFKYVPMLRTRSIMKHWLGIHIFFGITGPILVMIHSTFTIGSLNGGIALISMMLVLMSGIMGRFLYSKTHFGLGGQKARVKDLQETLKLAGRKIKSSRLEDFTDTVLSHRESLPHAIWELTTFGWRRRWLVFQLTENMRLHLNMMASDNGWKNQELRYRRREFKKQLSDYMDTLEKVALFHVYERFFAFWRNAHVPLLYLLLMSGVVHVIAVHMY